MKKCMVGEDKSEIHQPRAMKSKQEADQLIEDLLSGKVAKNVSDHPYVFPVDAVQAKRKRDLKENEYRPAERRFAATIVQRDTSSGAGTRAFDDY